MQHLEAIHETSYLSVPAELEPRIPFQLNKTFVQMLEALGYDIEISYVKR